MKRIEERENALAAPEQAGSGDTQFSPLSPDASIIDAQSLAHELHAALSGDVHFDDASRAMHATDASVYQILPLGVVTPRSREDVVQVVGICRRHGVSITARGGGTSQAGQAIGPGISLDFSRYMNRVLDLDIAGATVTVEPGIVLDELNAHLKPHGLHLPLDLSTSNRATIGGMIANNSAGTRSVIYGKTIDYVESLEVVLADGSIAHLGPLAGGDLQAKLARQDREGAAYRTVQRLGANLEAENPAALSAYSAAGRRLQPGRVYPPRLGRSRRALAAAVQSGAHPRRLGRHPGPDGGGNDAAGPAAAPARPVQHPVRRPA